MVVVIVGRAIGHLDDQSTRMLDQQGQCEVAGDDVCVDGEPQQVQPAGQGMLPYGYIPLGQPLPSPDVVDQDIQAAVLARDTRYQGLHLRRVQMIDLHGDALAASVLHQLGRLFNRFGTVILGTLRARGATSEVHRGSSRPSSTAMPRPAPRVAPATNATLPLRTGLIIQLSLARFCLELMPNVAVQALAKRSGASRLQPRVGR